MAEQATQQIEIAAPPDRCFDVAVDFEQYPDWADDVKEARVVEHDDEGRGLEVEFRAAAMGRSTRYRLRYDYSAAPGRLAWQLVDGDMMRRLDGEYRFDAADGKTVVTYQLLVDLKVPVPAFVKRRAQSRIMTTALDALRRRVES